MNNKDFAWLAVIVLIIGTAVWIIQNPTYPVRRGLDLQGGLQVLLEADAEGFLYFENINLPPNLAR